MADSKVAGIRLEAEGAEEFKASLGAASAAEKEFVDETKKVAETLTSEWSRAFQSYRAVGESAETALLNIRSAAEQGIKPSAILKSNLDLLFEAEQRVVDAGGNWIEIEKAKAEWSGQRTAALLKEQEALRQTALAEEGYNSRVQTVIQIGTQFGATAKEMQESLIGLGLSATEASAAMQAMGVDTSKLDTHFTSTRESAGEVGKAFFGLTLASFGLLSITKQLREQGETELIPTLDKITGLFQTVSSFGAAGSFIGGVPGAIAGGAFGLLVDLPSLLDQTSQGTKDLNAAIQSLGKNDEAIATLAKITGLTLLDAEAALKAAGGNKELRDAIEAAAKAEKAREQAADSARSHGRAPGDPLALAALNASADQKDALVTLIAAQQLQSDATNKQFDANSKLIESFQTENGFLEISTGLTKAQITEIQSYTSAHLDAGDALTKDLNALNAMIKAQQDDAEHRRAYTMEIQDTTDKAKLEADALYAAAEAEKEHGKQAEEAAKASQKFSDAIDAANQKLNASDQKRRDALAQAQQSFNDTKSDAGRGYDDTVLQADRQLADRRLDLWNTWQDQVSNINSQLADKIVDIQSRLSDKLFDIQTKLSDKLADIQQQLQDKIASTQQDLQNKLTSLAYSHQQQVEADNQKEIQAAADLARKLFEIERTRIEATTALSFNTAEQLRNAQSDHDREAVLRRHLFQQGQIDQTANDARNNAEFDFAQKVAQAEKEKQLADNNYRHEVQLAKELAQQKIADAIRTSQEQMAIARRDAAEQVAIAQREASEATKIAERENAQALILAEHRYNTEVALAKRAYDEQVKDAAKAEAEKLADAKRNLDEKDKAIAHSAELERAQIQATKVAAYEAFIEQLKNIGLIAEAYQLELNNLYTNYTSLGQKLFLSGIEDFTPLPPSVTTPPAGSLGAGGGTTIHAPNNSNSSSKSITNVFNVSGVDSAKEVVNIINTHLSNVAWN